MKLQNHILAFAKNDNETIKLFNSFSDYYNHFLSNKGVKGLDYKADVTFAEKETAINEAMVSEIMKRANVSSGTDIREQMDSPMIQWASFAIISNLVDTVLPVSLEQYLGSWADIQYGGYGDIFEFRKSFNGFLKVTKAGRAQRLAELQRIVPGALKIEPEPHMLTMETDLYRLILGLDSLAEMTALVARSMANAIAVEAMSALANAVSGLSNDATTGLRVAGYSQANLMAIASRVEAWTGTTPWIIGTGAALSAIVPSAVGANIPVDSNYVAIGHVTTAFGYPVFRLPQIPGATAYGTGLDDEILYIIPSAGKPIKVAVGGEMRNTTSTFEFANLKQTVTMFKDFGVALATGAVFGAIEL